MRRHRLSASCVVAIVILLTAAAPNASAHIRRWDSRVTMYTHTTQDGQITHLGGYVNSKKDECTVGRYVQVYTDDAFYGADAATDANGFWEVSGAQSQYVKYTIEVLRYQLPSAGNHRHICKSDIMRFQF